jgi:hypothetical protein
MSSEQEGEKGFRIVDKRGGPSTGSGSPRAKSRGGEKEPLKAEAPQEGEKAAAADQSSGEEAQALESVDVYGVLRYCIALLHSHAWQSMGLVPSPVTQKIERDMEQARIAIDCAGFLAERLEPKAEPEERASLRSLLTDLRLNFARQQERPTE